MSKANKGNQASQINVNCPYCNASTSANEPIDYAPFYAYCPNCSQKFIVERCADRIDTMKTEEAPCCSDPDCRELEMAGGEEE
ncbi:MAG: hypothetical protein PVH87_25230 [Desulfobacteraceae bacterium]|jgi:hypothetical protein